MYSDEIEATKAPDHFKENTQKWFEKIVSGYELESHHIRLLK